MKKSGLFKYFKVVWKDIVLAIFFVILETILETMIPFMYSQIVDVGLVNRDLPYIYFWGSLMILFAALSFFVGIIGVKYIARAGQGYGAELRRVQFAKLQTLDAEIRDQFQVSSLITRMTNDTYTIQNTIIMGFRALFRAPFMIAMVLMMSFILNAQLATLFAIILPIVAALMLIVVFKVKPIYEKMQKRFDDLNRSLQENFQAIRVVKAYVTEVKEIEKFNKINQDYRHVATNAFMTVSLNNPLMQLGLYASMVGLLYVGGNLIKSGDAKVGEITGLLTYVLQLLNALLMLVQLLIMFSRTIASVDRIKEVLHAENVMVFNQSEYRIQDAHITVKDVSFHYDQTANSAPVLEAINFELHKGETLGIIGQTGSGKSTLVALLARLYDVTSGAILVDGQDIRMYSEEEILKNIHIVFQSNMLFSGSILDNLKWGNKEADDVEIDRALKASLSDEIVAKLVDGLQSEVGQAGSNLSGGQKQRIGLARALLRRPKVLVLDDSLSAIDTINEGKIRANLKKYYPDLTIVMVSQRISAIKNAEHIIVLHEGRIHGEGKHQSLLATDAIYRDIYETQLKGAKA
ncbi:MAG: ABC transporter ATP-binding protein [Bacilli bacterium]